MTKRVTTVQLLTLFHQLLDILRLHENRSALNDAAVDALVEQMRDLITRVELLEDYTTHRFEELQRR